MEVKHSKDKLQCSFCSKTFTVKYNLRRQVKNFHSNDNEAQEQISNFLVYKNKDNFQYHCNQCSKNFNKPHHLKFNLKKIHGCS